MYVFLQDATDEPALNLAIEEALLHSVEGDLFMLWRDRPSVIIGRNQNLRAEIDEDYVARRGIDVVRRMSGGGAVYHDPGNLCFTFISLKPGDAMGEHAPFTEPVAAALRRLGVPAQREGRNDISAGGRKVSGNAQYAWKGRLCHHGTLLFDTDFSVLQAALRPDPAKIQGKGIASVSARVANLIEYLPGWDVSRFARALIGDMLRHVPGAKPFALPEGLLGEAERIRAEKYQSPAWTYGSEPPYDFRNAARFPGGGVELRLGVAKGVIRSAAVYGDFLSLGGTAPLEENLLGVAPRREDARAALEALFAQGRPLGGVTLEEFLSLI